MSQAKDLRPQDVVLEDLSQKRNVTADDDAAQILEGEILRYTPEEERQVVRKLDWILIPLMAMATGLVLVDKNGLSSAATLTIQKDLDLKGNQYSWAISIYFFGQMIGTYPANLLAQRFHTGKVVSIAFFCWGVVLLGTAGIQSFAQLAALRFLLGLFESAVAPSLTVTTARFYTQVEQPLRFSLWVLSNTVMPIPFLLIFFGLGHVSDHPLEAWRWIFVLLGLLTVIFSVVSWFVFPDKPSNTRWLQPRQAAICVERVAKSQVGIKNHHFKRYQAKEALLDVKAWLIGVMYICQQAGVGLHTNFSGIIIKGIGFSGLKSLLLQIPIWALGSITVLGAGYAVSRVKRLRHAKTLILASFACVSLICMAIIYTHPPTKTPSSNAMLLTLITLFNVNALGYPFILSMVGQNFAGTTKKQTVLTMIFILYCFSNIAVPQAFKSDEAPRYQTGFLVVMACMAVYVVCNVTLFWICRKENQRRDKDLGEAVSQEDEDAVWAGLQDETDKRNPRFRYSS